MADQTKIILKSGKDQSLKRYHPWVFSGAIKKIKGPVADGRWVEVYSNQDEFLGAGHYAPGSIAVRIISFEPAAPDNQLWKKRMQDAWMFRQSLGLTEKEGTNVFRLVNAEGDRMPGLIIDHYDGTLVTQFHSTGMFLAREMIFASLEKIMGKRLKSIYNKSSNSLPAKVSGEFPDGYIKGDAPGNMVLENGYKFKVDWAAGQKTGFFIDQRQSRNLLSDFAEGKKVLNLFGYTGGFSVYALGAGAESVRTVDSSGPAIDLARENVALNFGAGAPHEGMVSDAFRWLDDHPDQYDLVILDPPAFARHQKTLNNALQGYKRLNQRAIAGIKPGGIIFTFSCSQAVNRENFRRSVFVAAANTGREVRLLHQLSQPPDHPVSIYHPEGEYLKGLVLQVK